MKVMKHAATLRIATKFATDNIISRNNDKNFLSRHYYFSLSRYYPTRHHGNNGGHGIGPAVRRASDAISSSNSSINNKNSNNNNNTKSTNNILLNKADSISCNTSSTTTSSTTTTTTSTSNSNSNNKQEFTPLLKEYERQVNEGKLLFDPLQQRAARKLTRLQLALRDYDHTAFLERLELLERLEEEEQQQQQCSGDEGSISGGGGGGGSSNKHPSQNTSDVKTKSSEAAAAEQKTASTASASSASTISRNIPIPRGFYIYGDVGTGKSLLLNNFFNNAHIISTASKTNKKKRRIHFHSFLQEIHTRIHTYNTSLLHAHGRSFHINTAQHPSLNPILTIAKQLSNETTLLCIDEFQVTDVADAMMLSQFFGEVWRRGVVVVATSNRRPRDLYEGGVNREYFLPFLDLLERFCLVHHLSDGVGDGDGGSGGKDYRRIRSGVDLPGNGSGFSEHYYLTREGNEEGEKSSLKMDRLFQSFGGEHDSQHQPQQPLVLPVHFQRTISIPRYHSNVIASFAFDELCTTELGSSDYQAIANHFRIVMIRDVPVLTLRHPDRARRFITLIDELYEAGCCLIISAVDVPDRLFVGKETTTVATTTPTTSASLDRESHSDGASTSSDDPGGSMGTKSGDVLAIDVAQVQGTAVSELASVKELSFAFNRAASRILEMCSEAWWEERRA